MCLIQVPVRRVSLVLLLVLPSMNIHSVAWTYSIRLTSSFVISLNIPSIRPVEHRQLSPSMKNVYHSNINQTFDTMFHSTYFVIASRGDFHMLGSASCQI